MHTFTQIFLALLAAGTLLQLWLTGRQSVHVSTHKDRVPDAFATSITLDQHRTAARYTLVRLAVERWELVIGAALLLAWTLGGAIDSLDQLWLQAGWPPLWQGTGLVASIVVIGAVLDLPFSAWRTFAIEARFGFNRTTPARFAKDKAFELVLTLVLGTPLVAVILWLMQGAGELWWLYAWAVWMAFSLFITWAYPTLIAPLFNKFKPLNQGELRERLEILLTRCGFRSNGMFVMDGSTRSAHGNAYFTGFGRNKRIVFFDTLLDGLNNDEIEAVLAHELGHFKRRHVLQMLLLSAVLALAGLALLGWLSQQTWFYQALGVQRSSPALALTLFMLVLPVFSVFFGPLLAAFSRRNEFEADSFAATQTSAGALISGLVKMYRDNASTLTPDPWYSAFHHSHPPAAVRVAHLAAHDHAG